MFASFAVCPRGRRASSRVVAGCVVNSVPLGSAFRARRVCAVCGAVPWGLLLGRSRAWRCAVGICVSGASRVWRGWRCAMGIAGGQVAWVALCGGDLRLGRVACVACVALCHGDCCWAGRVGAAVAWGSASRARRVRGVRGAVPWGLLLGRSCGCRCAVGICVSGAWCAMGICVSGASRVWRGWRCAMEIAAGRVACVALRHGDCYWARKMSSEMPERTPDARAKRGSSSPSAKRSSKAHQHRTMDEREVPGSN